MANNKLKREAINMLSFILGFIAGTMFCFIFIFSWSFFMDKIKAKNQITSEMPVINN